MKVHFMGDLRHGMTDTGYVMVELNGAELREVYDVVRPFKNRWWPVKNVPAHELLRALANVAEKQVIEALPCP